MACHIIFFLAAGRCGFLCSFRFPTAYVSLVIDLHWDLKKKESVSAQLEFSHTVLKCFKGMCFGFIFKGHTKCVSIHIKRTHLVSFLEKLSVLFAMQYLFVAWFISCVWKYDNILCWGVTSCI